MYLKNVKNNNNNIIWWLINIVRFDWVIKNLLRSKANFCILEGFLSELTNQDMQVLELLESESNKAARGLKFNRVNVLIKTSASKERAWCFERLSGQERREYDRYLGEFRCQNSLIISNYEDDKFEWMIIWRDA